MKFLGPHVAVIGQFEIPMAQDIYNLDLQKIPAISGAEIHTQIYNQAAKAGITVNPGRGGLRGPNANRQVFRTFYVEMPNNPLWEDDGWHHDEQVYGGDGILLWSNVDPTEIRLPDGQIVRPEPNEIVAFSNSKLTHRMPKVLSGKERWFVRNSFEMPEWL